MSDDINAIRTQIDAIDVKLVAILAERFELVKEMKKAKQAGDLPLRDDARWGEVKQRVAQLAEQTGLDSAGTQAIFDQIHKYALKKIYEAE